MAWVMGLPAIAHVWDELAILARPNNEGTFTLEKYSFLQPTTYTNAVFFDFDNDENLDLLIMGQRRRLEYQRRHQVRHALPQLGSR